jgi:hypothetical protein
MILIACGLALAATALGTDPAAAGARSFIANLTPALSIVSADARGQVKFQLSGDGREIRYEIIVENIESVTQGHIHLAPDILARESFPRRFQEPSQNRQHGPIVAFLMEFVQEGVTVDGMLTKGVIKESDLVGPMRGYPLSRLIEFMESGDAYVALHVLRQVAPGQVFCCPDGLRGVIRPGRS